MLNIFFIFSILTAHLPMHNSVLYHVVQIFKILHFKSFYTDLGIVQLRRELDKLAPRIDEYSDVVNEQFIIMFKFLAFAASAAEAPVPQNMTKEINKRVQKSGTAKNIKTWMFWTAPQLEMLFNTHFTNKVCFISGNGVGKTVIMLEQATTLVKMGKSVLFCTIGLG